jgi:hypothetical protein
MHEVVKFKKLSEMEFKGGVGRAWVTNNMNNNRRQQFTRPVILTPDDDSLG